MSSLEVSDSIDMQTIKANKNKKPKTAHDKEYLGAGFIFYYNNTFLTGFSSHLKLWSGFGGKVEKTDKSPLQTAIREVIEEIFGINPSEHIIRWINNIKVQQIINRHGYILYICHINELKWISAILIFFGEKSPYYKKLPSDITELLTERYAPADAEVPTIEFLHKSTIQQLQVDHHFLKDIELVIHEEILVTELNLLSSSTSNHETENENEKST
jgi:hypothetical protein